MRLLSFLVVIFFISHTSTARADIYVDKELSYMTPKISIQLKAGQVYASPLSPPNFNADFSITVNAGSADIIAMICDAENANRALAGKQHSCINAGNKSAGAFKIEGRNYGSGAHYLVLDNSYALLGTKNIRASAVVKSQISPETKRIFEDMLLKLHSGFHEFFIFDQFHWALVPCGQKNAYSFNKDGSIVLCSEIILESGFLGSYGHIVGVIMHELGHSLLNLWGLPNYNNERTADEFATVFLLMAGQQEYLHEWINFFENESDPYLEARAIAETGDPHPLSVQRVKAIKEIMADPVPTIKRWNKVLYPHMTDNFLKAISEDPNGILGGDANLAQKILSSRQN